MSSVYGRVRWYARARRNAKRFGFDFFRRAGFAIPNVIDLGVTTVALRTLEEQGNLADFISVFLGDCYCLDTIAKSGEQVNTILDVGANIGLFSLAARSYFGKSRIHAYEPNQYVLPVLMQNLTGLGEVTVHPEAIWSRTGKVRLLLPNDGESNQGRTKDGGTIPCITLATAIKRLGGGDLVKLDCEGAEWLLLDEPEAWRSVRWLTMEYHLWARPGSSHADADRAVTNCGFEVLRQTRTGSYGLMLARRAMA